MRTKRKLEATVKGRVRPDGRNVVIPVALSNEPDRPVEVKIPRSKVISILKAAVNAAEKIDVISAPTVDTPSSGPSPEPEIASP
jgi:hypothetical protein